MCRGAATATTRGTGRSWEIKELKRSVERLTGGLNIWSDAVFLTFGLFFADEAFHHFYDRSSFLLDHPADRRDHVQAKQTRSTTLRVE